MTSFYFCSPHTRAHTHTHTHTRARARARKRCKSDWTIGYT